MGREDRQLLNIVKDRLISQAANADNREKTLQTYNTMRINREIHTEGVKWFEQGFLLEDAPENFKNDNIFRAGYEYGKTKAKGKQYFLDGVPFSEIQDKDKSTRAFGEGYRNAAKEANNIQSQQKSK